MPFKKGNTLWDNKKSELSRFKVGHKPWNFGLRKETDERVAENGKAVGRSLLGKIQSEETKKKRGIYKREDAAYHWLGDKVGYTGVHLWIRRHLGKASRYVCRCGKQSKHWANKDHRYRRSVGDYEPMCVSCHRKYDYKELNGKN